ncbi:MAG: DUF2622 domain-containing protein [Bryobacteraceae bacterium]|jgi:hypothetical protein
MPSFTTRVELHQASYQDYERLHAVMERAGFSRYITSDKSVTYHLPTAEYDKSGSFTSAQILNQAKAAANSTGRKNGVLVTESNGRTWDGLDEVKGGNR